MKTQLSKFKLHFKRTGYNREMYTDATLEKMQNFFEGRKMALRNEVFEDRLLDVCYKVEQL